MAILQEDHPNSEVPSQPQAGYREGLSVLILALEEGIPLHTSRYQLRVGEGEGEDHPEEAVWRIDYPDYENSDAIQSNSEGDGLLHEEAARLTSLIKAFFQLSRELKQNTLGKICFQPAEADDLVSKRKRYSFIGGGNPLSRARSRDAASVGMGGCAQDPDTEQLKTKTNLTVHFDEGMGCAVCLIFSDYFVLDVAKKLQRRPRAVEGLLEDSIPSNLSSLFNRTFSQEVETVKADFDRYIAGLGKHEVPEYPSVLGRFKPFEGVAEQALSNVDLESA
eukprot:Nk52_evm31s272 gene=Nk52_evmTU31s272